MFLPRLRFRPELLSGIPIFRETRVFDVEIPMARRQKSEMAWVFCRRPTRFLPNGPPYSQRQSNSLCSLFLIDTKADTPIVMAYGSPSSIHLPLQDTTRFAGDEKAVAGGSESVGKCRNTVARPSLCVTCSKVYNARDDTSCNIATRYH